MNIHAIDLPPYKSLVSEQAEALSQQAEILPEKEKTDHLLLLWVIMLVPTTLEHKERRF